MKVNNNHKAYNIECAMLVLLNTFNKFNKDVYKITFMNNDKRKPPTYYRDIKNFLIHLICSCYFYYKDSNNKCYIRYSTFLRKLEKRKY